MGNNCIKENEQILVDDAENDNMIVMALYNYESTASTALSFMKDQRFRVLPGGNEDWLFVQDLDTQSVGFVPRNYVAEALTIESEEWFFPHISRQQAEELLLNVDNITGTFLVRHTGRSNSGYSLSVKNYEAVKGHTVKHFRIDQSPETECFYISQHLEFPTVSDLIQNYLKSGKLNIKLTQPCPRPLPMDVEIEPGQKSINRNEISIVSAIGSGQFGKVYHGKWRNTRDIAIKELRPDSMQPEAFLEEANIMFKFRHENLVSVFAVCAECEPIWIIQEYMNGGSLLKFLRKQIRVSPVPLQRLVYFSSQIACGMQYLEKQQLAHRDLAARNVLIADKTVIKICDFGFARVLSGEDATYMRTNNDGLLPYKWTAPEALERGRFSTKSDVWSFGIVMMEIFTYGSPPYKDMNNHETLKAIKQGYRIPQEQSYEIPDEIYKIMSDCWNIIPDKRPTFDYLAHFLTGYQTTSQPSYQDM